MPCEEVTADNIAHVLKTMTGSGTLFLVGSGASIRLFPNYRQQAECILKCRRKFGYTVHDDNCTDTRKRVVDDQLFPNSQWKAPELSWILLDGKEDILNPSDNIIAQELSRIPNSAVQAMHMYCSVPAFSRTDLSEYAVFQLAPASVIATTNYDGLSSAICEGQGHTVLPLHGRIPAHVVRDPFFVHIIRNLFEWGPDIDSLMHEFQNVRGLWLPQEETRRILHQSVYHDFMHALKNAKRLVVIGYSFGGADDVWTLGLVRSRLNSNITSITIIDPQPEGVMESLAQQTRVKEVVAISASWPALAQAIMEVTRGVAWSADTKVNDIAKRYSITFDLIGRELDIKRKSQCENCPLRKEL